MNNLTFIELCGGHSGTGEGFVKAGFTGLGNFDINNHALKFSQLNHPDIPIYKCDLLSVNVKWIIKKVGKVRVLIITCPCQGISLANPYFNPNHPLNRLLIRCIRMIPFVDADVVVIENVKNITQGEMKRLKNIIIGEIKKMTQYRFCDGIMSGEHYNVPQERERWICLLVKREYGIFTMPSMTTIDEEALKIINVVPELEFIKGGYDDGNGVHHKLIRSNQERCFTLTATPNAWNERDEYLTLPQVRDLCGYRKDWIYDEMDFRSGWRLFGNSVMPPMAHAIAEHIKMILSGQFATSTNKIKLQYEK